MKYMKQAIYYNTVQYKFLLRPHFLNCVCYPQSSCYYELGPHPLFGIKTLLSSRENNHPLLLFLNNKISLSL